MRGEATRTSLCGRDDDGLSPLHALQPQAPPSASSTRAVIVAEIITVMTIIKGELVDTRFCLRSAGCIFNPCKKERRPNYLTWCCCQCTRVKSADAGEFQLAVTKNSLRKSFRMSQFNGTRLNLEGQLFMASECSFLYQPLPFIPTNNTNSSLLLLLCNRSRLTSLLLLSSFTSLHPSFLHPMRTLTAAAPACSFIPRPQSSRVPPKVVDLSSEVPS